MTSQMTENMLCAICQDTMNDPVTALCGAHNFCKTCLAAHIHASIQNRYQTPTCPTCRVPIQTAESQLHINVALRDMIASATSVAVAASASASADTPAMQIKARRIVGTTKLHVELLAPSGATDTTMPTPFIPVGHSSVDSTQASSDAAAFSRSDLVRHAIATQIELLRPEDQMALVLFDHNAMIALSTTQMTDVGRTSALLQLMAPLVAYLQSLPHDTHVTAVLKDLTAPGKDEGQFDKAFASTDAFVRWGQYYMSEVVCGLEREWPINFKDATSD